MLLEEPISRLFGLANHNLTPNTVILSIPVAIDDPNLRSGAKCPA